MDISVLNGILTTFLPFSDIFLEGQIYIVLFVTLNISGKALFIENDLSLK